MTIRRGRGPELALELGGALAPPLERAHGVTRREVERTARRLRRPLTGLLGESPPSGFLAVLRRPAVLREVEATARRWRRRGVEDLIHVGIGGSSLGAETVLRALAHPFHNHLPRRRRRGPRVHFVDNVDPDRLGALLDVVDLRRSLIHVVSKSGGTVETAAGFQALRDALGRSRGGRDWAKRCVFTTGQGVLRALAEREGVETLAFPEDVGGRFSVLTASGLLTPAIAGVDVGGLMAGARRMRRRLEREPVERSPAAVAAAASWLLAERRDKPVHVLMPYADALEPLARWWVQLAGESLGKRRRGRGGETCVGPTPLPARGTTDQHSQVQLFVDGPPDKLVCFVRARRGGPERPLPGGEPAAYLEGVHLGELLRAEQRGTAVALARAGRPTLCWEVAEVAPGPLGQLFVALETQTALMATLYGVDAFDQPGVEAGKIAAFALIGREGYEETRARIEADAPPAWTL